MRLRPELSAKGSDVKMNILFFYVISTENSNLIHTKPQIQGLQQRSWGLNGTPENFKRQMTDNPAGEGICKVPFHEDVLHPRPK